MGGRAQIFQPEILMSSDLLLGASVASLKRVLDPVDHAAGVDVLTLAPTMLIATVLLLVGIIRG